ncbi:MAG: type I glyceraldehyde-3-phosphate dehydrogenase [Flavobacteriales bacterium]|nr:type I glyceraldehyde-3-phosphate dehydrogenase [Flavobacteriales bacterium]
MTKKRVAINGFGRIGRLTLRNLLSIPNVEVVAINDLSEPSTLAHLFKYDSIHRQFPGKVIAGEKSIEIDGNMIYVYSSKDPSELPWKELNIDVVIESTGRFRKYEDAIKHVEAGAKKVVLSAPGKSGNIPSLVIGINEQDLDPDIQIISNASCTTNCAAPMIKIIDDNWGIESAFLTTVHSYTSDQRIHDAPHRDLRRARAAAENIIPTTTGAANALIGLFPHLEGKIQGSALRVPVPTGSLTDLTILTKTKADAENINAAFLAASNGHFKDIISYTEAPIVSTDIISDTHSCIFDSALTSVQNNLIKISGWYDNEMGYSARLAEMVNLI